MNEKESTMFAGLIGPPNAVTQGASDSSGVLDLRRNTERTVDDIPNSELLERAVRHAVLNRGRRMAWVAVMDMLALGSTFSMLIGVLPGLYDRVLIPKVVGLVVRTQDK